MNLGTHVLGQIAEIGKILTKNGVQENPEEIGGFVGGAVNSAIANQEFSGEVLTPDEFQKALDRAQEMANKVMRKIDELQQIDTEGMSQEELVSLQFKREMLGQAKLRVEEFARGMQDVKLEQEILRGMQRGTVDLKQLYLDRPELREALVRLASGLSDIAPEIVEQAINKDINGPGETPYVNMGKGLQQQL